VRRLLYVALTRARDHLVLPVLPAERDKLSWATPALTAMVRSPHVTRMATDGYFPAPEAEPGPRPADALEGGEAEVRAARASHAAWEEVRSARRRRARGPKSALGTVTEMVDDNDGGKGETDAGVIALGRLVLALLARTPLDGSGLEALSAALASEYGLGAAEAAYAAGIVAQTLKGPLFDRVRAAVRVLREVPITATVYGQRVSGVIDLAFLEGGRWTVVVYQTGEAPQGLTPQEQVRLYGQALQATTDIPVLAETCVVAGREGDATGSSGAANA
jgi:ATP-dependent exoDNAse (exonuclease V) beta subunit